MPLTPILQDHADERAVDTAREAADDREIAVHVGCAADDLLHLSHVTVGVRQGRAFRPTDDDQEEPPIVFRNELVLQPRGRENEKRKDRDRDDRKRAEEDGSPVSDGAAQQLGIPLRERVEAALKHLEELAMLVLHPEDLGAQHRREGQRDEARDHDRARDRDAEFAQQPARGARQERERRKHRHQRNRGGDDGEPDFVRAA